MPRLLRPASALLALGAVGCSSSLEQHLTNKSRHLELLNPLEDLGDVPLEQAHPVSFTLDSTGLGDVSIAITISGEPQEAFSVTAWPELLPAGESATIDLVYTPTAEGWHRATVVVTSDAEESVLTAELRAHAAVGDLQAWPALIDFGPVAAGGYATAPVTLRNNGVVDVTLEEISFAGSAFSLVDQEAGLTLRPEEEHTLTVRFDAATDAAATDTLALEFSSGQPDVSVQLLGNACGQGLPDLYDADADGYTSCGGDCADADPSINPASAEVSDEVDNDCDGDTDEGTYTFDDDDDGYSELEGDCNDGEPAMSPGAAEIADNGIDDDCDGTLDDGDSDPDGDGYNETGGDCDPADASVYPGGAELADGKDNDCDGALDEGTAAYDDDGDGLSENDGDCDDADAAIWPGESEAADWQDNDCDGSVDEGTVNADDDGDGFTESGGDCDDADDAVSPAETETSGDGIDNDCDGAGS